MTATGTQTRGELLEGQNRVLELIAQEAPLPQILDVLLGVIQEQCPGMPCSILLLEADGIHVRHGAARGLPETFVRAVDGQAIGPRAGSCGTAASRREAVIVEDIATDPLWDDYRELALRHGLRACWSTPIFDAQRGVIGTFAMYFHEPARPDGRHLHLIDVCTHIAAIAIAKHLRVQALQAAEERLRLALSGGNVDLWEYDVAHARLRWQGQLSAGLGRPANADDVTLASFLDAVHPADRERARDALTGASGKGVEFRVMHSNGSPHWLRSTGRGELDTLGNVVRVRGVALEITERKHAEEEIQQREAQLVAAQRIAHIGSYEWDVRTNAVRRSAELCRIFGVLPEEFEPTFEGYLARIHPEDRQATRETIERAFAQGQPFDFEERIVRPDGSVRLLHSQGQWSLDEMRHPAKLVGICQDITERQRVEQQLRAMNAALAAELEERTRAEQEIQALTARLIHAQEEERTRLARELHDDLSQQVATLSIAASNLKRTMASESNEARAQSERMQQKLMHLAESVRRLSHNLHPAILEYSGLGAALHGYCSEFSAMAGLTVSFRAEGSCEDLPGAVALCLYRIAQEALQNVLKHARVNQAEVVITRSAEEVRLIVSDQGVGVDMQRVDSTPRGLGLVSIKERTRLVNGTLQVESQPRQGTVLTVTVPLIAPK